MIVRMRPIFADTDAMRYYIPHTLLEALPCRGGRAIIKTSIAHQVKPLEVPCQVIGHVLRWLIKPIVEITARDK